MDSNRPHSVPPMQQQQLPVVGPPQQQQQQQRSHTPNPTSTTTTKGAPYSNNNSRVTSFGRQLLPAIAATGSGGSGAKQWYSTDRPGDWDPTVQLNTRQMQYNPLMDKYLKFSKRGPRVSEAARRLKEKRELYATVVKDPEQYLQIAELKQKAKLAQANSDNEEVSPEAVFEKARKKVFLLWDRLHLPLDERRQLAATLFDNVAPAIESIAEINNEIERLLELMTVEREITKKIELRESFIYLIQELVERQATQMDNYAAAGTRKELTEAEVVAKLPGQKSFGQHIANIRSCSFDIISNINKWRHLRGYSEQMYFWRGVPYLCKMATDLHFIIPTPYVNIVGCAVAHNPLLDFARQFSAGGGGGGAGDEDGDDHAATLADMTEEERRALDERQQEERKAKEQADIMQRISTMSRRQKMLPIQSQPVARDRGPAAAALFAPAQYTDAEGVIRREFGFYEQLVNGQLQQQQQSLGGKTTTTAAAATQDNAAAAAAAAPSSCSSDAGAGVPQRFTFEALDSETDVDQSVLRNVMDECRFVPQDPFLEYDERRRNFRVGDVVFGEFVDDVDPREDMSTELFAAVTMQRLVRGYLQRLRFRIMRQKDAAATHIQRKARQNAAKEELELRRKRYRAAAKIQAVQRGIVAAAAVAQMRRRAAAAGVVQRVYRGHLVRRSVEMRRMVWQLATRIQALVRGFLCRRRLKRERGDVKRNAATNVQRMWKGVAVRTSRQYNPAMLRAAVRIQAWARACAGRRKAAAIRLRDQSAARIQTSLRKHTERRHKQQEEKRRSGDGDFSAPKQQQGLHK